MSPHGPRVVIHRTYERGMVTIDITMACHVSFNVYFLKQK